MPHQHTSIAAIATLSSLSLFVEPASSPIVVEPVVAAVPTYKLSAPVRTEKDGHLWKEFTVSDPKVTLVVVRNHHLSSSQSPDDASAVTFWSVQDQVLALSEEAAAKYTFSAVYPEAVTDKFVHEYNLQLSERQANFVKDKPGDCKSLLTGSTEPLKACGAMTAFALRHQMKFSNGASHELNRKASEARRSGSAEADDLTLRQREDYLLSHIHDEFPQGTPYVLTNFGADHNFVDNINEWNRTHPDFRIALIEISPKLVRELRDEMPKAKKR